MAQCSRFQHRLQPVKSAKTCALICVNLQKPSFWLLTALRPVEGRLETFHLLVYLLLIAHHHQRHVFVADVFLRHLLHFLGRYGVDVFYVIGQVTLIEAV